MERSASMINSFFFIEGERKRLYLSFDCLFLTVCYLDLLSAECIRNVTRDEGIADGGSEGEMVAGAERPQKRVKVGLNVITDRGDKNANYQ